MKGFIIGVLFATACSTIPSVRKFGLRRYRPISDKEAKINKIEPVGKMVFRYCKKYSTESRMGSLHRCRTYYR